MINWEVEFSDSEIPKYLLKEPPQDVPEILSVMKRGEDKPSLMKIQDIEKFFHFSYRAHVTLANKDAFLWILKQCPFLLRIAGLAKEQHEQFTQNRQVIDGAILPDVSIQWINPVKEYGLVTLQDISAGAFVAEYGGLVRKLHRLQQDTNAYCLYYPTILWSLNYCAIDAQHYGNVMRFVNHDDNPNLEIRCLFDRSLLHIGFFAKRNIIAGEELTFDYGPDFWRHRQKQS